MQLDGLQYVMLGSTDIERSLSFYRDTLGLEVVRQFEGFAFLGTGATTVVLTTDLGNRIKSGATFASEIVFAVPSVEGAYRELLAVNVDFISAPSAVGATLPIGCIRPPFTSCAVCGRPTPAPACPRRGFRRSRSWPSADPAHSRILQRAKASPRRR